MLPDTALRPRRAIGALRGLPEIGCAPPLHEEHAPAAGIKAGDRLVKGIRDRGFCSREHVAAVAVTFAVYLLRVHALYVAESDR